MNEWKAIDEPVKGPTEGEAPVPQCATCKDVGSSAGPRVRRSWTVGMRHRVVSIFGRSMTGI